MTPQFRYQPISLDRQSLRLVCLLSGEDERLRCHLFDAWLDDEDGIIEYEALSYTWGPSRKSHTILLDGCTLAVTENLYMALGALRQSQTDRILWIDAICIDQENDLERGHQVRQMSFIYKKAERVMVWLGPSIWATNCLMKEMYRLELAVAKLAWTQWSPSSPRWLDLWRGLAKSSGEERVADHFLREAFLQRLSSP